MVLPNFSLEGKVALVTGGSRGIGRAIALTFAEAGADVAICSRNLPELEEVAEEIRRRERRSVAVAANIGVKSDVENLVQRAVQELGTIDILVNNAAMNILAPLLDLREDGWDKIMNTDLKGYYLCSQIVGKVMVQNKKGNIINIASTAAARASHRMGAYCIAKAGVVMLTKVLAVELAEYNIRANAIAPGMVKTKFSQPLWSDATLLSKKLPQIPLGRLAEPEEIVGAALFLASDASSYITGHTIFVDGGTMALG
jgi:NAD(P)-dependent dehydrogenase (short-subunit alcohol dehydrogenase family)